MDQSYYTDEMKSFVRGIENKHNFPVDISIMSDDDGPYLVVSFPEKEYTEVSTNQPVFEEVAELLYTIRRGLQKYGARVTYLIYSSEAE